MSKVLSYIVVPETSAIWTGGPSAASGAFDSVWQECCKLANLRLVIPEITKLERIKQMAASVQSAVDSAKHSFEKIGAVCGSECPPCPQLPTAQKIMEMAEVRFSAWLTQLGGEIANVPYAGIQLNQVVSDAVEHRCCFDAKNDGFKDRMIFETFKALVKSTDAEPIVFICKDGTLSNAVKAIANTRIKHFSDVKEFLSNLQLVARSDETRAPKLREKAHEFFYTRGNQNCVFEKWNVYPALLSTYYWSAAPIALPIDSFGSLELYPPDPNVKVWIESTSFDRFLDGASSNSQWKTRLRCLQKFRPAYVSSSPIREHVQAFIVTWTGAVDDEMQFSDSSLKLISREFGTDEWRTLALEVPPFLQTDPVVGVGTWPGSSP